MIRVGDLTLFSRLEAGALAPFTIERARTVKLSVNAPHRAAITIVPMFEDGTFPEDEEPMFLATVHGLEEVEFFAHGAFAVQADADLYLKSVDGNPVHAVIPDAATFTRIAERRARNPEIEALQQMLLRNQERRMGAMFDEVRLERERNARERAAIEAAKTVDSGKGAPSGDKPPSEPAPRAGKPAGSPPKDGDGNKGGEGDA